MRLLLAAAALTIALAAPYSARAEDDAPVGMKKGFNAFTGIIRGTVKLDGDAIWIEQAGGPAVRVASDKVADWQPYAGRPVVVNGDFTAFGGTPAILVRRVTPRKERIAADRANLDVKGRVRMGPQGVALETKDGFVFVNNPDVAAKMRDLGAGAQVRVKGTLTVANGEMSLNANRVDEVGKGGRGDHKRKDGDGKKLGKKRKSGKASAISLTLGGDDKSGDKKEKAFKKKTRKSAKKASAAWGKHKDDHPAIKLTPDAAPAQ